MVGKNLAERGLAEGLGLPRLRVVRPETVKLLLLRQRRLIPLPLCGGHVEDDREVLGLEKLEHLDERGDVVAVHRAVVGHAQFLKDHTGEDHPLYMLLRPPGDFERLGATQLLDEVGGPFVQVDEP